MLPPRPLLVGFAGQILWPLGLITLPIAIYDYRGHLSLTIVVDFMITRASSPYNIILGSPGLRKFSAIPYTLHYLKKSKCKKVLPL